MLESSPQGRVYGVSPSALPNDCPQSENILNAQLKLRVSANLAIQPRFASNPLDGLKPGSQHFFNTGRERLAKPHLAREVFQPGPIRFAQLQIV